MCRMVSRIELRGRWCNYVIFLEFLKFLGHLGAHLGLLVGEFQLHELFGVLMCLI